MTHRSNPTGAGAPVALLARGMLGDLSWVAGSHAAADELAECARSHGVDKVIWYALHDRADAPSGLITQLAAEVVPEIARAAIRERELARVLRVLAEEGIGTIVFKGAALAYTVYEKPWLRPRLDTDLFVKRSDVDRAIAALAKLEYVPSAALSTGEFVSHQVALQRTDGYGLAHTIDLHWRAVNPQLLASVATFEDLWMNSNEVRVGTASMRVPAPLWSLLLACTHRLAHHRRQERLIWLYDLHVLAWTLAAGAWPQLEQIARERGVSALCADGLGAACRLFGTHVPSSVLAALARDGASQRSRHYVERDVGPFDVLRDDLRELSRWRDRGRLLREHLFPSAAFMRARYGLDNPAWLPLLYAHRLITGAYKWIRA